MTPNPQTEPTTPPTEPATDGPASPAPHPNAQPTLDTVLEELAGVQNTMDRLRALVANDPWLTPDPLAWPVWLRKALARPGAQEGADRLYGKRARYVADRTG
jgi:hypothetical protein